MNSNVSVKKKTNVRKLVIVGVLSGVSIMLSLTPLGYIPIGPLNLTIMHIPVIIGAIIEGPLVGMMIGFMFGMTSLVRAFVAPTVISFVLMNPLISVLPRVIMGIATYYVYMILNKMISKEKVSLAITGVVGSLMNTVGVLGSIYLLYGQKYVEAIGKTGSAGKIIGMIAVTNGLPEAILAGVIVSSVVVILKKTNKF